MEINVLTAEELQNSKKEYLSPDFDLVKFSMENLMINTVVSDPEGVGEDGDEGGDD